MACDPDKSESTDATRDTGAPGEDAAQDDADHHTGEEDPDPTDTGSPCPAPQFGVVTGQVNEMVELGLFEPQSGARVLGRQGDQTIQAHADEDGLFTLTLPNGTWMLEAQNPQGNCFSSDTPTLEITSCSSISQDLIMDIWDVP